VALPPTLETLDLTPRVVRPQRARITRRPGNAIRSI